MPPPRSTSLARVPTLREVTAALDSLYDPGRAEPWDAIGPVCGDPGTRVERVLLAVDPVSAVVRAALDWGADLLVTHHPLFLRPVHDVAATSPKGSAPRISHRPCPPQPINAITGRSLVAASWARAAVRK